MDLFNGTSMISVVDKGIQQKVPDVNDGHGTFG